MTWAPSEAQIAIYSTLNGDSTLNALLGSNKIFDHVPDNTDYPYLTLHIFPLVPRDNYTKDGVEIEFQITAWVRGPGRGSKDLQAIQKRVDELLHKASLSISGWAMVNCRRSLVEEQTLDDNVTKQGIQRFKLQLGET